MEKTPWSEADLIVLKDKNISNARAAFALKRSPAAVRGKRQRLGVEVVDKRKNSPVADTSVAQDLERSGNQYWKSQFETLRKKYETVLQEGTVATRLIDLASSLAPQSYSSAPAIITDRKKAGKEQSAVLMLTDTHVGAVVKPDQTLGFGGYDFDIFRRRLKFLEQGVESIITDHVSTTVPELVLCLGGDMLDGALIHSAEVGQVHTLFEQYYAAGHALAQFIRNTARLVPSVRIYIAVGNHTRWGTQKKMPTTNRYSNLDMFLYAYLQALTADIGNVKWNLDRQPFARFSVQGFEFHLSHGDHLRGGDKALGIPNHSVGRMVSSTTQLCGKFGEAAPHYYLVAHLHRSISLPHARGSVIINGGFPGLDGYGLMSGFTPADPTQTLFFVHPRYGKTASFDIQLKFAPSEGPLPYEIPTV